MARRYTSKRGGKGRLNRRGKASTRKAGKPLTKLQKKQVVRIVHGQAETKTVAFYQTSNAGNFNARSPGLFSQRGWAVQNNAISNNFGDIHQLIPFLQQGTDDNTRIGQRVTVTRLQVRGAVRVNVATNITNNTPTDLKVFMFVLQHVSLKDYASLFAQNNFNQLLETNEPANLTAGTVAFTGIPQNAAMSVAKQYYKVCHRKEITLRYAGIQPGGSVTEISIANCHTWYAEYSLDLTKDIPKVLQYPETDTSPVAIPFTQHTPTNSSLFMSFGFVDWLNPNNSTIEPTSSQIEQTYVSRLSFKDM